MKLTRRRATLALSIASATLTACGGGATPESVCEAAAECESAAAERVDKCIAQLEQAEKTSNDKGCGDEFGAYLECVEDAAAECNIDALQGCDASALQRCLEG